MFIAALLTIAKTWKQLKCPSTDKWIKKIYIYHTYIWNIYGIYIYMEYIYNGILLSHKKNEIMPFAATGIQLEIIILSELRKK